MALYTQKSIADFADDWNRIQRQELERQQEEAAARLAASEAQAQQAQRPGGIAGILAGIGESIGNVGNTLYDIGGRGINSIADIFTGKVGDVNSNLSKWNEQRKQETGATSDKDYLLKTGGRALDAASTVSDFIPGLGTGAKIALNIGQGGLSGVAREFAENGENASVENALKNAAAGAAGSAAGQFVGGKLAKRAQLNPAKGIIGKAAQSSIGRGAISGAVSGAVGGGVGSGLAGGNVLEGALQGAESGALGGATTTALYNVAGAGFNKAKDLIENGPKSKQALPVNVMADQEQPMTEGQRRRTTPMGWDEQDLTGAGKKKNYLQKLGGDLQDAAQATRDSAIYGRLKGNTADEMIQKDAINNLRKNYGYSPDDYRQASDVSTAVNKWYDNEIQSSGAEKVNTKLSGDLALPTNNTLPEKYEKAYTETIRNALNMANAGDSDVIDKYTASGLEKAAKYLGEQEQKMRRTNMNGVGGRPDGDRAELADYYKNARQTLRNEVNSMIELDDTTKSNLAKMLDKAGATKQTKDAILKAKNFSEVKAATSPLEDARTMYRQMKSSGLKRSAAGDNSVSLGTQVATKTGAGNLLDVGLKPVRTGVAAAENVAGKAIQGLGNAIAGDANGVPGKIIGGAANVAKAATQSPNIAINTQSGPINIDRVLYDQVIRQSALRGATQPQANQKAQEAQKALSEAQAANDLAAANLAAAPQTTPTLSQGAQQLTRIKDAMGQALAAGDFDSYNQLASLYSDAYKIYGSELEGTTGTKLTTAQQSALDEANNSLSMVDQLENAYKNAGGGQGFIQGNLNEFTNWLTGGNANAALNTYNSLKQSLGTSIVKNVVNLGGTEADAQRYLAMLPSATDTQEQAAQKLNELRTMLNNMKANIGSKS